MTCTPASGSCGPRSLPGVPAGPRPHCAFMTSLTDRAETGAPHPPGPGSSVEGLGRAQGQVRRCRPPPGRPELPARGGVSRRAVATRHVPCLGAGEQLKDQDSSQGSWSPLCRPRSRWAPQAEDVQAPLPNHGGPAVPRRKEGRRPPRARTFLKPFPS